MKTKYEHIHFVRLEDKPKTSVWLCAANEDDEELGVVKWYGAWRQYCFHAAIYPCVFNVSCLEDICDFIRQLGKQAKRTNTDKASTPK